MTTESIREYERLSNTYYYQITSEDALPNIDEIGNFVYTFPPFPYPEHNESQRAIFTLQGCIIGDQVVGQQLGQTTYFSLSIEGLGLRGQSYNTGMPSGPDGVIPRNTNSFLIPNVYDEPIVVDNNGAGAITYTPVQTMAGSYDLSNPIELVCGNPVGNTINFKLFDNVGALVADNVNFNTIVRFKIELIPN